MCLLTEPFYASHIREQSVKRIGEKGHTVHFGPNDADNFIQNIVSGERLKMQRKGNSYVIRGELCGHNPF